MIICIILLTIVYVIGIIKLYQALKELENIQNGYMAKRIDMMYEECKRKELDDGK